MTTTPTPPLALPALPEPQHLCWSPLVIVTPPEGESYTTQHSCVPYFTADQMDAYATAAILSDRAGRGGAAELRESDRQLMRFYNVETIAALIDAQERHIVKLQAKLPPLRDEFPRTTRIA